mgnify:CR=1 FL=1
MFDFSKLKFNTSPDLTYDPPASDEAIAKLEAHYGHNLPEDLKEIFKHYHGRDPGANRLEVTFPDDEFVYEMDVAGFLYLDLEENYPCNIWYLINDYAEYIGENTVPFADDYAQHIYYLKYNSDQHEVWYLEHEEVEETRKYKVCDSFEHFLSSMYNDEE